MQKIRSNRLEPICFLIFVGDDKVREVFVKGLEISRNVIVSYDRQTLSVRLQNTPFVEMCQSIKEKAPQVCEQIGCPICSLVACVYTEYTDKSVQIVEARCEGHDITLVCNAL